MSKKWRWSAVHVGAHQTAVLQFRHVSRSSSIITKTMSIIFTHLMWYSSGRFISYTICDDGEVSLLIDSVSMSKMDNKYLEVMLEEEWVPIKRCQKAGATSHLSVIHHHHRIDIHRWSNMSSQHHRHLSGFTETGVVSTIASPLSGLSMYYMSSFMTGWFMVKRAELSKVLYMLQVAGFQVVNM